MVWWLSIILLIPLSILTISDIRSRTVSSWWLLIFGILNLLILGILDDWESVLSRIVGNLLLLLVIGAALWIYAKARRKLLPELLGLGDVIFLISLSPAFEWAEYLRLIVASSLIGILVWPFIREKQPNKMGIPMVSVMAFVYVVALGNKLFIA